MSGTVDLLRAIHGMATLEHPGCYGDPDAVKRYHDGLIERMASIRAITAYVTGLPRLTDHELEVSAEAARMTLERLEQEEQDRTAAAVPAGASPDSGGALEAAQDRTPAAATAGPSLVGAIIATMREARTPMYEPAAAGPDSAEAAYLCAECERPISQDQWAHIGFCERCWSAP